MAEEKKFEGLVFAGNSNPMLAEKICGALDVKPGKALVSEFSDGEVRIEIQENVRRRHVYVVQTGAQPVDHHIMELLIMIDALKRASAQEITAVIPYYPYSRQDRKNKPRVPITASMLAGLLTKVGAHRILTMDLHAGQIQGFFDIPVDNLYGYPVLLPYIEDHFNHGRPLVIVSPDAGGVARADYYAKKMRVGSAYIDKRRPDANEAEVLHIKGDVARKVAIVLDDMADTLGTATKATAALLEKGAEEVHLVTTHAVLSGPAIKRLEDSEIKSLVVTDTLPLSQKAEVCKKIKVVSVYDLLAKAMRVIEHGDSMTTVFEKTY